MHNLDAPDTLILQVPVALHDQIAQRAGRYLDAAEVASQMVVAGFDLFETRVLHESPVRVLQEFTDSLTRWSSNEVTALNLPLTRNVTIRLRLSARAYEQGIPRFALLCLAQGLKLSGH